jgi:hypothetical protein
MTPNDTVIFVDVDDTLLDNDRFQFDLKAHLEETAGIECRDRYWAIQEGLFKGFGYRDYLGAFQKYHAEYPDDDDIKWQSQFVLDYPFERLLYPKALAVIAMMRSLASTVVLTDGDVVFQPRKLERSGIAEAVQRKAMICLHKEQEIDRLETRYPASKYVLIDDKLAILTAFKRRWGERVTTVFPLQGQFAHDTTILASNPPADRTINAIGDLLTELPSILDQS